MEINRVDVARRSVACVNANLEKLADMALARVSEGHCSPMLALSGVAGERFGAYSLKASESLESGAQTDVRRLSEGPQH